MSDIDGWRAKGIKTDAASASSATFNGRKYPLIQWITVEEMLHGKRPNLPLIDSGASYAGKTSKISIGQQDNLL